jgi:hypothetical protein
LYGTYKSTYTHTLTCTCASTVQLYVPRRCLIGKASKSCLDRHRQIFFLPISLRSSFLDFPNFLNFLGFWSISKFTRFSKKKFANGFQKRRQKHTYYGFLDIEVEHLKVYPPISPYSFLRFCTYSYSSFMGRQRNICSYHSSNYNNQFSHKYTHQIQIINLKTAATSLIYLPD